MEQLFDPAEHIAERIASNQQHLISNLKSRYDFIVCGSGSSGSVVARRLAENPDVDVLLIEAGGHDDVENVHNAALWPTNLGSDRDWGFQTEENPDLNRRRLPFSMGKVLGGGSSINVMVWARGHQSDWDFFAAQADDAAWNYKSVLDIFRRIEDWQGEPDPQRRGTGGLVFVQPAPDPSPLALQTLAAAESLGIPRFNSQNGPMMEGDGGCALTDVRLRDGKRLSVFRSYVHPLMHRPNLTVLTEALVTKLSFVEKAASGVEIVYRGSPLRIEATREVVLSLGAINTPKVLMQSGIGDRADLSAHGIEVIRHLPGVGRNLQDHTAFGCTWEYKAPIAPRNNASEATIYWKSTRDVESPDLMFCQVEFALGTPETVPMGIPEHGWTMFAGLARPHSRGRLRLSGANPDNPVVIDGNFLSDPRDMEAAKACIALCRDIGNAQALLPLVEREALPRNLQGAALGDYIRNSAMTFWHQSGTAKMGRDDMAVVDGKLKVHGIEKLRIADASIMPRITTGNTMAACVVIGERAADILKSQYGI